MSKNVKETLDTGVYDEQRQKVARCAVEWVRAFISLHAMARDLKKATWEKLQEIAPRMALEPDTSKIDAQLRVADALLKNALGLGGDEMNHLKRLSDLNGPLNTDRFYYREIGAVDASTTADPLHSDSFQNQSPRGHYDEEEISAAMAELRSTEPTLAQALSLIARLSESETKKAREWSAEGRADMAEVCSGRVSILNRVLYELHGGREPAP